jgi:hypothetical protein
MTWEEVKTLLNIKIDRKTRENGNLYVEVKMDCFNKKGYYMFSEDMVNFNRLSGITMDTIIQHKIISDFELTKWVGEKIELDTTSDGYFNYK